MANKFIQSLDKVVETKLPDFENMDKGQLINYINENCNYRDQSKFMVKLILLTFQQIYQEEYQKGGNIIFDILEGTLTYDVNTEVFVFSPNPKLKDLLVKAEEGKETTLRSVYKNRFYKMVETLYLIERGYKKEKGE